MAVKVINNKMKLEMQKLRNEGKTAREVAKFFEISPTLVYSYTKTPKVENKADKIKKLIAKKKKKVLSEDDIKEIANKIGVTKDYVKKIMQGKLTYEPKPKLKECPRLETTRDREIKEVCKKAEMIRIERVKSYAEELEKEKIELKERLGYAI